MKLLATLLLLSVMSASADVVIALKPDKDPDKMLAERQSLASALTTKLGQKVEVIVPLSAAVIIEGLSNGSIDAGYLSATDLVHARKAGAASLLLAGEIAGKREYTSYWLGLAEKPYTRIEDLRGKPIAFASRTSTSGYLIPQLDLYKKGLIKKNAGEFFGEGNVWFGTGYASAVERVLSGEAEAAAVSDYVFDKEKHLSAEQRARLKIITRQGPVPTHVIAVASRLDAEKRQVLTTALLDLGKTHPDLRDAVFTSPLVETDEATHLAPVVEALEIVTPP
jgi:phosphonate transport system substrate-binding protein